MPLQIRRGTETERLAMTQKLAAGEPLWITTTSKLYIGDGTTATPTLLPVTGFTSSDAQDAAAALFTNSPTHSGISFVYDTIADKLTATVDLSNYNGVLRASSFKGSLVADDSSVMVDAIENKIYAGAGFFGNVTGNITGNTTGYHSGDVKGSLFGDDSSKIVDAVENKIYSTFFGNLTGNSVTAGNLTLSSSGISIGTSASIDVYNNFQTVSAFRGINANGLIGNTPHVDISSSRGTVTAPTNSQAGDWVGTLNFAGYYGGVYQNVASIISKYDDAATLTNSAPGGAIGFAANDNNGGQYIAALDMKGIFTAPIHATTVYSAAGTAIPNAATMGMGARAFVSDATVSTFATAYTSGGSNKVPVYSDGTVWRIG
jgi:hypothetical protein